MRLRRLAAVAAAGIAGLATTAAMLPGHPVDRPQPLPALTARALDARYAADARLITRAARTASRTGNTDLARALDGMRGHHFIDFNPRGSGLAVEVVGNLARARRVAILVPGSDTSLTTFDSRGTASPEGARPRPRRRGAPPGPEGQPRGHRLAGLRHAGHVQPGRADVRRRRAGRRGPAAAGGRPRPARPPGRPALPQLRLCGVRPGRAAPAGHRHRGVRQPGDGRLLGAGAAQQRPGVGRPGVRRLDP